MNTKKLISIFFLILIVNGVFASSIDVTKLNSKNNEPLYFQEEVVSIKYEPNTVSSCYTEALSPEAVERLWNEILVKGFKVDLLSSNQPANLNREKLDKNEVIITSKDTKANDTVGKTEIPNQLISPLEIPTVLGQVCSGPFSHGLDLDNTLRVGRCQGGDTFACYLENEGLFRQNGRYGFVDQTKSIGKDLIDMVADGLFLDEIGEGASKLIDPALDFNTNVELGLFSDMSYQEIAEFRKTQFSDNDITDVEIRSMKLILDNSIKNSIKTDSFNASMESTCNSDNCYINMYSLFDKVFNMYYSADLVFTSASPVLWKFSGKIFRNIPKVISTDKLITKNVGGFRGKHGFLDNLLNKKMDLIDSALTSYKYGKISKNMDSYVSNLAKSNATIVKNIDRYNMRPEFEKFVDALNSKKNIDTLKNEFFNSGTFAKLNKSQQRVFMDSVLTYQNNLRTVRMMQDVTSANIKKIAPNSLELLFNKKLTMEDFYASLTRDQYTQLSDELLRVNKLNKEFSGFTEGRFMWDDGSKNIGLLKNRGRIIGNQEEMLNKVRLKNEVTTVDLTNSNSFGGMLTESPSGYLKNYETKRITVNFADGPGEVEVIVPFKKAASSTRTKVSIQDVAYNKHPDILIEYTAKDGTAKAIRGSVIDMGDIDVVDPIYIRHITEAPIPDADLSKYGINPIEVSAAYFQELGAKKIKDAEAVTDGVVGVLNNQGWTTGRGYNYINQRMKQQTVSQWDKRAFDLITDSGKAYVYNFGYWQVKTAGSTILGGAFDRYSMIRVPETYTSIIFKHGEAGDIYNDSYIDFFANDGSDQGDLFQKYFNSILFWMVNLPKEALANTDWETANSISDWIKNVTEGHIRRSFTDNIVLLTDTMKSCNTSSCQLKVGDTKLLEDVTKAKSLNSDQPLNTEINNTLHLNYQTNTGVTTTSYLLEHTSTENFDKYGQTLIAFSHHTDYDGAISGFKTDNSVNLLTAIKEEDTCSAKLKNLEIMGVPIGWTNQFTGKSYRAGAIAAGFSNVIYYALSVPQHRIALGAVFGDLIPQMMIVPEIYNCVDHEEGYYTHFFVAKEEFERIEKDPKNKIGDAISKGASSIEKTLVGITKNTELQESISKTTEEVKQFAENKIKDNPIMQSRFETLGNTSASFEGKLFFLELGEASSCRASGYNDKGVEHLIDNTTGDTLIIDKEKGEVKIVDKDGNVKNIIGSENKDWVRLIATNLGIPAKVIPHYISYIPVPDTNTPLFNIDVYGNLKIEDIDFLNCLKSNYYKQTGLEMTGNVLTNYLGSVKQITSTNQMSPETQYDLIPKGRSNSLEIVAEGTPRKAATGEAARVTVLGDRTTKLYPVENQEATIGKNIAIQFERGQLIYNGEKNSYIMWVEQTYVMHQSEIKGMDVKPIKETNPVTGCEENAFEMSISPDMSNPEAISKSEEMNKALEKVGPFQMFETESKTFIFYTTPAPECQQRMKIIDKKTGEVIDKAINSILTTPDGFIVTTEDGQQHNFEFSAEDGIPKLKYNDLVETLLSAQGKNGSFWYDPQTGNWYTENGHLIPFNPEYRDGVTFKAAEDGKVYGTTVQNLLNPFSSGGSGDRGTLNIPLTPQKILPFTLYVMMLIVGFLFLFNRKEELKKKRT